MQLIDRYKYILDKVNSITIKSGRSVADVRLLPISKTAKVEDMITLATIGVKTFGESRQQDGSDKLAIIKSSSYNDVEIEFIGRLQSNKIRKIVADFSLIHSVDNLAIAKKISTIATEFKIIKDILIQLNLANENQKAGVSKAMLDELIDGLYNCEAVRLRGFMLIPPIEEINQRNSRYFIEARKIYEKFKLQINTIDTLSMGMSDDFDIAIKEGSTVVRIGRSIFS